MNLLSLFYSSSRHTLNPHFNKLNGLFLNNINNNNYGLVNICRCMSSKPQKSNNNNDNNKNNENIPINKGFTKKVSKLQRKYLFSFSFIIIQLLICFINISK